MVMFGLLMITVTYGVTQDVWMALFVGGILMFGKQIAEGLGEMGDESGDESDSNTKTMDTMLGDNGQTLEEEMGWE